MQWSSSRSQYRGRPLLRYSAIVSAIIAAVCFIVFLQDCKCSLIPVGVAVGQLLTPTPDPYGWTYRCCIIEMTLMIVMITKYRLCKHMGGYIIFGSVVSSDYYQVCITTVCITLY